MTNEPTESTSMDAYNAQFAVPFTHRLRFTRDALSPKNETLANLLRSSTPATGGLIAVLDDGFASHHPTTEAALNTYFKTHDGIPELRSVIEVTGGEDAKNTPEVAYRVLGEINAQHICRKSSVLVIGGGAVLDAAGYAAAVAHRGVGLFRMPSTVLGQCDSGVGVKNGINFFGKKNFIGTFAPPLGVLCDTTYLSTLSDSEFRCGISEIIKIGLLRDEELFDTIEANAQAIRSRTIDVTEPLIAKSAALHMQHIVSGGDPFELDEARPLDFGHWSAHKLEQMTDFALRHGDAVSIGLALDMTYAALAGLCEQSVTDRVLSVLCAVGLPTSCDALARTDELLAGLEEFREHLGGTLTITLLSAVGKQLDVHSIDKRLMRKSCELRLANDESIHSGT